MKPNYVTSKGYSGKTNWPNTVLQPREKIESILDFILSVVLTTLKIIESEIKGKETLLKAEGLRDGENSTGSIEKKLEDEEWKILKDSWKAKMK